MKLKKSVIIEELTRTMAIVGIVMFGVLPLANILGLDLIPVAIIAFPLALLSFPLMLVIRTRTDRDFKINSKKGLILISVISNLIFVSLIVLRYLSGQITLTQTIIRVLVGGLVTLVLGVITVRVLKLK